nr:GNAT family N-acetyltransferase [uncultured Anaeromusa sp.]
MMTIQPLTMEDIPAYAVLGQELFEEKTHRDRLALSFGKIINNPDYILVGAKDDAGNLLGAVMGIVCLDTVGECRPFMVLENLIVGKASRRQGLGKKLVEYVEAEARTRDCYFAMLMSLAKRKEAHAFYESMGYSTRISLGFKKYF